MNELIAVHLSIMPADKEKTADRKGRFYLLDKNGNRI
jgi:hypothetical protein